MLSSEDEMTRTISISSLLTAMQSCISDVKDWSLVDKLRLSEDKTEALLLIFFSLQIFLLFYKLVRLLSILLTLLVI